MLEHIVVTIEKNLKNLLIRGVEENIILSIVSSSDNETILRDLRKIFPRRYLGSRPV